MAAIFNRELIRQHAVQLSEFIIDKSCARQKLC